jgi:hypothetical protein
MRATRAARAAVGVALLLALFARPTHGGDLAPDEQKWVRTLLDALSANSPSQRRGAEAALTAMGIDALPDILDAMPLKSDAAKKGLMRAMRGMGTAKVRSKLDRMREPARGALQKRIEDLLSEFGAELSADTPVVVALRPATDLAPEKAPLRVERALSALEGVVPEPFTKPTGKRLSAKPSPDSLLLDADGDGTLETKLAAAESKVVLLGLPGPSSRVVPVLFYRKADRWYACASSLLRGTRGKVVFEWLDADLDGSFDGPADERRVGDGAFGPNGDVRTFGLDEGPASYQLVHEDQQAGAWSLKLLGVRRPESADDDAWEGLIGLGVLRMRIGLAAPGLDVTRCRGCKKHCEYLVQNAASDSVAGLLAHTEKAELPGYSEEGAAAGGASGLAPIGDTVEGARALLPTLLHRSSLLADASTAYGIGCAKGRSGWAAIWGGGVGVPAGAPLVVPAPGQTGVPPFGSAEVPDPDEPKGWYARPRGYPIAVYFAGGSVPNATLKPFDGTTEIPAHVWTPKNAVSSRSPNNDGAVFLMPDAPLSRATTYRVELTADLDGKAARFVWSFSTM